MRRARRQFLAAAAGSAIAGEAALAQDAKDDPIKQQVDACMMIACLRFNAPRDGEEEQTLRSQIQRRVLLGELLSRTRLANGDEPATIFVAE